MPLQALALVIFSFIQSKIFISIYFLHCVRAARASFCSPEGVLFSFCSSESIITGSTDLMGAGLFRILLLMVSTHCWLVFLHIIASGGACNLSIGTLCSPLKLSLRVGTLSMSRLTFSTTGLDFFAKKVFFYFLFSLKFH